MRNSSLVEGFRAENVTGLKPAAEAVDVQVQKERPGPQWQRQPERHFGDGKRGNAGGEKVGTSGYCLGMVGERSSGEEGKS